MKPVYQTEFGPKGNCFAACLATILERDLAEVPDFRFEGWAAKVQTWLAARGYAMAHWFGGMPPSGLAIAGMLVPDGSIHAAVFRNGRLVHDPSGPGRQWARAGRPAWWMQIKETQ